MKLDHRISAARWLIACAGTLACTSPNSDALFVPADPNNGIASGPGAPTGGFPQFVSGGFAGQMNPFSGGAGGAPPMGGTGGFIPNTGGAVFGTGGTAFGTGGSAFGSGGFVGSTGGSVFGSGGFVGSTGGNPNNDAGGGGGGGGLSGCVFSGTWGSYISQPVTWPATPLVLDAGQGNLQQWNLTVETQVSPTEIHATTVPCGIFLPDLQSSLFGGFAKYGIRFPFALFDAGAIPHSTFTMNVTSNGGQLGFTTDPFAILVGLTLDNAASAPWPGTANIVPADHDLDGQVGVTVIPATGSGYSNPPADLNGNAADFIYIAERTVSALTGVLTTCNDSTATVNIATIAGSSAIDSSVIGCHLVSGGNCTADQASFIDSNRPHFTPNGSGSMTSIRLPNGATCHDVRAQFPQQ